MAKQDTPKPSAAQRFGAAAQHKQALAAADPASPLGKPLEEAYTASPAKPPKAAPKMKALNLSLPADLVDRFQAAAEAEKVNGRTKWACMAEALEQWLKIHE